VALPANAGEEASSSGVEHPSELRRRSHTRGLVLSVTSCYGQCVPGDKEVDHMKIAPCLLSKSSRLFV